MNICRIEQPKKLEPCVQYDKWRRTTADSKPMNAGGFPEEKNDLHVDTMLIYFKLSIFVQVAVQRHKINDNFAKELHRTSSFRT